MMRFGLAVVAALLAGAVAAHFLLQDRGYVLIDFRGYIVEMSVPGLVLVLAAAYLLIRAAAGIWRAPRALGTALADRRTRRAGMKLTRGLMQLADGNWAKGERLLTQGARGSGTPLVNYLMAARAAHWQGSRERRDEWLRIAYEAQPDAEQTVLLTQAELQLEAGEHERALATASRVLESAAKHPVALALAARACVALGDRRRLAELLPRLGRAQLSPELLEEAAAEALRGVTAGPEVTQEALDRYWKSLPADIRALPRLLVLRARALDRLGLGDEAERELRSALKRRWSAPLVAAYGEIRTNRPAEQLRHAEAWLRQRPEDAALLVAAARLCVVNELWGKARSYLESAIAIDPAPASYALYGRLLDRLGENDGAALAFRSGLALVDGGETPLPALAPPRRGRERDEEEDDDEAEALLPGAGKPAPGAGGEGPAPS
ncbi:MAG TPA: heme biosynthesis HemY N-terminal domain-containing protein [Gammaproteobacteria bacterium]